MQKLKQTFASAFAARVNRKSARPISARNSRRIAGKGARSC